MKELEDFLVNNGIYLTHNVIATFGKVLENYKFQEIALLGEDVSWLCDKLRKDYKIVSINVAKELCYSLTGLNLSRVQLKENTRLIVAVGDQHYLNLAKLLAQKYEIPFFYVTKGAVSIYAKNNYAILDSKPIEIFQQNKGIIVEETTNIDFSDAYAQITSNIFSCFEFFLKEKFFEEHCELNLKKIFDTYYEILNIEKLKSHKNFGFLLKLNLLQVVEFAKNFSIPYFDSYYITLRFLRKNINMFAHFNQINFVFTQMLAVLYEMYFKNELNSPLCMLTNELEKMSSLNDFANALAITPAKNCEKSQYVYKVYVNVLASMSTSFQNLYEKISFRLKNLMSDSGFGLFNKLDCESMIKSIKETSLFCSHSLLNKFGITELT